MTNYSYIVSLSMIALTQLSCSEINKSTISENQAIAIESNLASEVTPETNQASTMPKLTEVNKAKNEPNHSNTISTKLPISKKIDQFKTRKYSHVTELYAGMAQSTIDLCVENKVPPAAILAIVSLESGWGSGYIGQITGNILSLNATKGNAELPALYLPVLIKDGTVLYDENDIAKYSKDELEYQNRPASLKKDYRPANIAGTTNDLAYFKYHPTEKTAANVRCINDFITRFVSHKSSIAAYREARTIMDDHVEKMGVEALFDKEINKQFINTIGGRPNSFNFRETWPKKVEAIMNNVGLVELTMEMHIDGVSFEEAW